MKITTYMALVLLLSSSPTFAGETNIEFECELPEINWIYKFSMSGTITLPEDPREVITQNSIRISDLSARVRRSGNNSSLRTLKFKNLKADIRYHNNPEWTKYPFLHVNIKPKNPKENLINRIKLNFDYPGKLTSSIRLRNGEFYRSTCEMFL